MEREALTIEWSRSMYAGTEWGRREASGSLGTWKREINKLRPPLRKEKRERHKVKDWNIQVDTKKDIKIKIECTAKAKTDQKMAVQNDKAPDNL